MGSPTTTSVRGALYTYVYVYVFGFVGFNPNQMSTPYPNMSQSFSQPQSPMGMNASQIGGATGQQEVVFSGKHNGLCLYLARLLRPIWEQRMVSDVPCQTTKGSMAYVSGSYTSLVLCATFTAPLGHKVKAF